MKIKSVWIFYITWGIPFCRCGIQIGITALEGVKKVFSKNSLPLFLFFFRRLCIFVSFCKYIFYSLVCDQSNGLTYKITKCSCEKILKEESTSTLFWKSRVKGLWECYDTDAFFRVCCFFQSSWEFFLSVWLTTCVLDWDTVSIFE